jgi:hypothetical protein
MYASFVPYVSQNKQPLFRYHREHVGLCNSTALFFTRQERLQEFNFLKLPAVQQTEPWIQKLKKFYCSFLSLYILTSISNFPSDPRWSVSEWFQNILLSDDLCVPVVVRNSTFKKLECYFDGCPDIPLSRSCWLRAFPICQVSASLSFTLTRESDSFRATVQLRG